MESRDLFARPARPVRPRKPLALIVAASIALPGAGHILLGRARMGLCLLGLALVAPVAALTLRGVLPVEFASLAWLVGRTGVLSAAFAAIDAPLLAHEPRRIARRSFQIAPRTAAFLNLIGYGLGHWRMDEKPAAWTAFVTGGLAHAGALFWLPAPLVFLAEVVPLALAAWAWRTSFTIGRRPDAEERPVALRPPWLVPAQGFAVLLFVATGLFAWTAHGHWLAARHVDQSRAVAMEPYYRNPSYGIDLEMRAPGWSFRDPPPTFFVDAWHVAERSRLRVSIAPRLPGRDGDDVVRSTLAGVLAHDGIEMTDLSIATVYVGNVSVHRVHGIAQGADSEPVREVVALSYPAGFRRYLLQMDWDPGHADFGEAEWDFVLNGLRIEGVMFGTAVTGK